MDKKLKFTNKLKFQSTDTFSGDDEMLIELIKGFDEKFVSEKLTKLYNAMLEKDWKEVKGVAHQLKVEN